MMSRRFGVMIGLVAFVILVTGCFTAEYFARDLQKQIQVETRRLAYARVLLSTRLLAEPVLKSDYAAIKAVLVDITDDTEIACLQYRDGHTLVSTLPDNQPCQMPKGEALFSIGLGDEYDHSQDGVRPSHDDHDAKKVLEVAVKDEVSHKLAERTRWPYWLLSLEFALAIGLILDRVRRYQRS